MQRTFELLSDPGHGWGKVPFAVLRELGLNLRDFSNCSWLCFNRRTGRFCEFVYLEEDGDLMKFIDAYVEKTGQRPKWRERFTERAAIRFQRNYYPNSDHANLAPFLPRDLIALQFNTEGGEA